MVPLGPFRALLGSQGLPPAACVPANRQWDHDGLRASAPDLEREVDIGIAIPLELLEKQPPRQQLAPCRDEIALERVDLGPLRRFPLAHRLADETEGADQARAWIAQRFADRRKDVARR